LIEPAILLAQEKLISFVPDFPLCQRSRSKKGWTRLTVFFSLADRFFAQTELALKERTFEWATVEGGILL